MGNVIKKAMWVGRTTATAMGLALVLALMLGVATTALAAVPGDPFKLGQLNVVDAVSRLAGANDGPLMVVDNNSAAGNARALDLRVEPGKAPMKVNSDAQVANLNADQLDGKSANEIGVNGQQHTTGMSAFNSDFSKVAVASCPDGKVLVGIGFFRQGLDSVTSKIDIEEAFASSSNRVQVGAYEDEPTDGNWGVAAQALCATAP